MRRDDVRGDPPDRHEDVEPVVRGDLVRVAHDLSGVLDGAVYRIICRDDGSGDAETASPDRRDGLGLRIMTAAVRQLDGSLVSAPSEHGFTSLLEFPVRADR